jgi:hypothetical protein
VYAFGVKADMTIALRNVRYIKKEEAGAVVVQGSLGSMM